MSNLEQGKLQLFTFKKTETANICAFCMIKTSKLVPYKNAYGAYVDLPSAT